MLLTHRGAYYLFATLAAGWWRSADLLRWHHVRPSRWPVEDVVAPAALSVRDTLFLLQSAFEQRPVLFGTRPETGRLEFYNRWLPALPQGPAGNGGVPPGDRGPWDPALFHDARRDAWYLYWGSSNTFPLFGIRLDPARRLAYDGVPRPLLRLDPARHGWERFGRDHRDTTVRPFVEGAWMTEHRGRYYLQYGAPGTEHNAYATGTYVGSDPLGPFAYAPYNPVAYKPGGFVTGAGHGNTVRDLRGGWWVTGTPWVGANWAFERRIAMFPAAFEADGQFHASTRFGDFPHRVATRPGLDPDSLFAGWMLLSYRKAAAASSARDSFPAARAADEDPRTFWVAAANRPGETLTLDLGGERLVRAVQVNFADYRAGRFGTDSVYPARFRLLTSADGRRWRVAADLSRETRDRPNAYLELARPTRARYVRYEHGSVAAAHLAVSDLRVFGHADGPPPAAPADVRARRDADPRNMHVAWAPVPGAVGYNVRWGVAPGRLYQTYQVWADRPPALEVRALTVGQRYWVAVESFDERGVSPLSAVLPVP